MKINVSSAPLAAIDWAVAQCQGVDYLPKGVFDGIGNFCEPTLYTTDWAQAGLIIDEAGISIIRVHDENGVDERGFATRERIPVWAASTGQNGVETSTDHQSHEPMFQIYEQDVSYGSSPLIAAMRCYVTAKMGEVIDVPDEILEGYGNLRNSQGESFRQRG